jgi:hypothetical protein
MSFTSRDLRGWFHIFTSLPLIHMSNPDFWGNVFDLASSWFLNPFCMKIFTHQNPRISQIPDCIISQVHDSRASQVHDSRVSQIPSFRLPQPPDSRISRQSPILKRVKSSNTKAKFDHYLHTCSKTRETFEIYQDFFMITPFHKTGPFFHYWFTNMFHEFWQFDVSRVQVFYRIPNTVLCGMALVPDNIYRASARY